MISITITDDHPLIINGLKQILQDQKDIQIVATYASGQELLNGLKASKPDIVLLDLHMPDGSGEEVAPAIARDHKGVKIIALTNQDNTYYVKTMFRHGVSGYVLKTSGSDTIVKAIRTVYEGETFVDPLLKDKLVQESLKDDEPEVLQLTRREKEILQLIASNYSSQEIADQLFLSKRTIDNHRLSLLMKLGVKNSATLIKKAMQMGLIE